MTDILHQAVTGQSLAAATPSVLSPLPPPLTTTPENPRARMVNKTTGALIDLVPDGSPLRQRPELSMLPRIAEANPGQTFATSTHAQGSQTIAMLSPGGSSGKFEEGILTAQRAKDAATASSLTYLFRGLTLIQGEANVADGTTGDSYGSQVVALHDAWASSIATITGQTSLGPFVMAQTATWPHYSASPQVALAQLKLARTMPDYYLIGGQYQLPGYDDGLHLTPLGYYYLGELAGRAWNRVTSGAGWLPFSPNTVTVIGAYVILDYDVPTGSLVLDTTTVPEQPNYGFSVTGVPATIANVAVTGPKQVTITMTAPIQGAGGQVGYGVTAPVVGAGSPPARGNLRDSDPGVSAWDGAPLRNWAALWQSDLPAGGPLAAWQINELYLIGEGGLQYPITLNPQ